MLPKYHFIFGTLFVFILHFFFPQLSLLNLSLIFLSSFLIDADHYFYYIARERNFNLIKCYNWYREHLKKTLALPMNERKKIYSGFYFFHGLEWLIALFLLGRFISPIFTFVFIGFSLHWVVDTPHEYYIKRTLDKSSLVWNYLRFRKLNYFRKN